MAACVSSRALTLTRPTMRPVPADAQGGAIDACRLAATKLTVISVRTQALVCGASACTLSRAWPLPGQPFNTCSYLSRASWAQHARLLGGRIAYCVTQQTPACHASSAVIATRCLTEPAVSSLLY